MEDDDDNDVTEDTATAGVGEDTDSHVEAPAIFGYN